MPPWLERHHVQCLLGRKVHSTLVDFLDCHEEMLLLYRLLRGLDRLHDAREGHHVPVQSLARQGNGLASPSRLVATADCACAAFAQVELRHQPRDPSVA